ncbi:hypothetical protein JMJ35_001433 [Cladonia borealis]|uniref:Uncharacterized protein n=1 Tax=Cladonia borealis TaxID=184061 RepID=A0AA39RAD1_9LECA|nr:hypothetical protein JMJ35_001433 [Cladonia borealis]
MRQQRICDYLGLECSHRRCRCRCTPGPSILSFPSDIRHQIYQEADIISDRDIDLGRLPGTVPHYFATSFGDTYALLQTNRTIYTELSSHIYSTNRFFIHYRTHRSFQRLRSLSPTALASLRHLTIHLIVTSCEASYPCCNAYCGQPKSCDEHDRALGMSTKRERTILNEKTLTAAYIFRYIRSSTLHFHFVCDISTPDAGPCVLAPLSTAGPLASCAIRLARRPHSILEGLARDTALRAMGRDHQATLTAPFRFLDLPVELQKHILYFTDLVSPLCEIQYSPTRAYHLHYSTCCCGGTDPMDCHDPIHHACAFRNCWQRAGGRFGCFCSVEHAAFWTECRCWQPPTALFLVSKAVLELAREVFLGANRFLIVPEGDGCDRTGREIVDRTPERMPATDFLTQVVPRGALRHLRFLEVVFPPFRTPWMLAHEPAFKQWQQAIEIVRDHLTLPALTLRVCFADKSPYDFPYNPPFRTTINNKEGAMEIWVSYMRIMYPLRGLKGLSKLFVHAAWPYEWTERGNWRRREQRAAVQREVRDVEARLERMVMGEEYESESMGKRQLGMSQWTNDALVGFHSYL